MGKANKFQKKRRGRELQRALLEILNLIQALKLTVSDVITRDELAESESCCNIFRQ